MRGEAPFAAEGPVGHAGERRDPHAVTAQQRFHLRRPDEFRPVMRALRQPAQEIFRADDRQRIGFGRAVEGRAKH